MDSKNIFRLLVRYKYSVIIIILLSGICAVIFSSKHFITPLYKSKVVMYPTSTYSISKSLFNTNKLVFVDPLEIGDEDQTDQMLQILKSNIIKDKIIEKYNLMEHYGINQDHKYKLTNLYKEFDSKIKFRRTEHNAVMIMVLDSDPVYAANIANDISELFDITINSLQKEYANKALEIVENEYDKAIKERTLLEDSLKKLHAIGIYDYDIQITALSEQLAIEIARGNEKSIENIEKKIEFINNYKNINNNLNIRIEQNNQHITDIKSKLEEARIDATHNVPHKFVVTTAYITEKPSYPIRWIIVSVTMISTFMLLVLLLIFIENYSEQKNNKNG